MTGLRHFMLGLAVVVFATLALLIVMSGVWFAVHDWPVAAAVVLLAYPLAMLCRAIGRYVEARWPD